MLNVYDTHIEQQKLLYNKYFNPCHQMAAE